MNEMEIINMKAPWPKSTDELVEFIQKMEKEATGYGTSAAALTVILEAVTNYVGAKLGLTGFQVSHAELTFLKKRRGIKAGFRILNYDDLLYPQYLNEEHFPSIARCIQDNKDALYKMASHLLSDHTASPTVVAHWKFIKDVCAPEKKKRKATRNGGAA